MSPGLRLLWLLALGALLWLLELVVPGAWAIAALYGLVLLGLALLESLRLPGAEALTVRRELPARFSYDDWHEVSLELINLTAHTLTLQLREELPAQLKTATPIHALVLPARGSMRLTYPVYARARGLGSFGPLRVRLEAGLRLSQRSLSLPLEQAIKVYPRFKGVDDYQLLARLAQREEAVRRPRLVRGAGLDLESLRPYAPGDDLRSIDWKATARHGTPISRNRQVERGQQLALLMDTGRLMGGLVDGHPRLEHAFNAAVRLSYVVQKRGDVLSLVAFSNRIEAFMPPARGQAILPQVLETLCPLSLRQEESDYWQVTTQAMNLLKRRSLVICFTDVLDTAGSAGLMANLTLAASRHLVLCVVLSEPRIEALTLQSPAGLEDVFLQAAACDLLARRRLALEHMRARGIQVLETEPAQLSVQLVRRYLEIRQADLQ